MYHNEISKMGKFSFREGDGTAGTIFCLAIVATVIYLIKLLF